MPRYEGACHCGAVNLVFRSEGSPEQLGARDCQCSFCTKHGASWTSDPNGSVELHASAKLRRYPFGTATAEALLCPVCGVVMSVASEIEGKFKAVIRVESLSDRPEFAAHSSSVDFDLEELGDRLQRRAAHWTPLSLTEKD